MRTAPAASPAHGRVAGPRVRATWHLEISTKEMKDAANKL